MDLFIKSRRDFLDIAAQLDGLREKVEPLQETYPRTRVAYQYIQKAIAEMSLAEQQVAVDAHARTGLEAKPILKRQVAASGTVNASAPVSG